MSVSIRAAWLFLFHGHDIENIRKRLGKEGLLRLDCTKQRMSQYIKKGTKFLVDRAVIRPKANG